MGVLGEIRACQTGMGDQAVIDSTGRRLSTFPSALFSGEVEIERGDLARILYDHSKDVARYVFGDHITALAQAPDGVDVTFARGPARRFDLVVGADGMHSAVRRLTFAEEDSYRHDLGLAVAGFTVPNTFGLDHSGLIYNEPGRLAMVASGRDPARAAVGLMFTGALPDYDWHDTQGCKRLVAEHFAGAGGRCRRCSRRCAMHRNSTSTRSARSGWTGGRPGGSCCSAMRPGAPARAATGPGTPCSARTRSPGELALAGDDHAALPALRADHAPAGREVAEQAAGAPASSLRQPSGRSATATATFRVPLLLRRRGVPRPASAHEHLRAPTTRAPCSLPAYALAGRQGCCSRLGGILRALMRRGAPAPLPAPGRPRTRPPPPRLRVPVGTMNVALVPIERPPCHVHAHLEGAGQIAAESGVAVQTIYSSVGSKAALVLALNDLIDEEADVAELTARLLKETDAAQMIAKAVQLTRQLNERCGDLIRCCCRLSPPNQRRQLLSPTGCAWESQQGASRLGQRLAALGALRAWHDARAGMCGLFDDDIAGQLAAAHRRCRVVLCTKQKPGSWHPSPSFCWSGAARQPDRIHHRSLRQQPQSTQTNRP